MTHTATRARKPRKPAKPARPARPPHRDKAVPRNLDGAPRPRGRRPTIQPATALIWRVRTVCRELGITRQTLWDCEHNPASGFPARYPLVGKTYGYARAEIFAWLERRRDAARLAKMPPPEPDVEAIAISSSSTPPAADSSAA
jgi:predicted DNA-binding transcriptional regulator AlpA